MRCKARECKQQGVDEGLVYTPITLKSGCLGGYNQTQPMPLTQSRSEVVRSQLDKILSSAGFARNERLRGFLRFVIDEELSGRGDQLKESVIGLEVFGRRADYDVRQDSVVRTEAIKLRARLAKYYATDGVADLLVIELPKGRYIPVFHELEAAPAVNRSPWSRLRMRLWLRLALAGIAVATAAIGTWWVLHKDTPIQIGVLPLVNLGQDPANDYFADGLTDEIIRNLSIIEGLAVRSQTSSFVFKGKPRSIRDAAKQLGADYILEGSVLRSGQQLRINAQLVRARDDFPLWSGRYDRELTDIFAIQDEISRGIVNSLRLKLGRGRRRYETSVEAYDLYLRGRALEVQQVGLQGVNQSIGPFEQAIAKDPSFAPAYAGLARAYAALSGDDVLDHPDFSRPDQLAKTRLTAEKGLQLDPLLPEAHDTLGMVYAREAQWERSEKSYRSAIALDPNRPESHDDFAMFLLLPLGRIEEAVAQVRIAQHADPLSPEVQEVLAYVLISAGRFDEAAAHGYHRDQALLGQGRIDEAIRNLEAKYRDRLLEPGSRLLGVAYARAGRREEAERVAASVPRPLQKATIFAALGDRDRAVEALERGAPLGPVRIGRWLTLPEFAPLRGDPRLKALRKKVGLPE